MADAEKPTLIHLQNSCSQSVLWLLEELNIECNIRKFSRGEGTAPAELKETHPQGKSPQLILPSGRVVTQLSAVLMYLLRTYDTEHRFSRTVTDPEWDPVREDQLCGILDSDLASKLATKFMFHGMTVKSPWLVRPLLNKVRTTINSLVLDADVDNILKTLEGELEGRDWFQGGDSPSRPDFMAHFYIGLAVEPEYVTLDGFPKLAAFMERCEAREAWKKSLEKGNGYDLNFPAKW